MRCFGRPAGAESRLCATVRGVTSEPNTAPETLWTPSEDARSATRMGKYLAWLEAERGLRFETYEDAWRWSVEEPGAFWQSVWDHFGVRSTHAARRRPRRSRGCPAPAGSRTR